LITLALRPLRRPGPCGFDVIVDDEIQFVVREALVSHMAVLLPPIDQEEQSIGFIWLTTVRHLSMHDQVSKHPAASRLGAQR